MQFKFGGLHRAGLVAVLLGSLMVSAPASADPAAQGTGVAPEPTWQHGKPFAYSDGLLGSLGGARQSLSENGIDVHLSLMSVFQSVVDGGVDGDDRLTNSYDFQVYVDGNKLGLWEGLHGLVRLEGKNDNAGVNPATGAVIPVNFDAVVPEEDQSIAKPTEWLVGQEFVGGKVEVLGGMYDVARFFDITPTASPYQYRFMNLHMFFNSALIRYAPYNILGGVAMVRPTDWLTITTGVGDPDSSADDVNWYDEGDYNLLHEWRVIAKPFGKMGWYQAGVAYQDRENPTIAQTPGEPTKTDSSDWAFYASGTQWLYQDPKDPHRSVTVFGRFGATDGDVNLIENHYSLGLSFDGVIFESRPKDVAGIVGWYNSFSDDLPGSLEDESSGFEAFYRFQATPWWQISPDVQYLIDPGLNEGEDDTLVVGLRSLVHF